MKEPLPDFVDEVLRAWDFIAFFAYDNFESIGRGVVGLMNTKEGTQAVYGTRDYFLKQQNHRELGDAHEIMRFFQFLVVIRFFP
ncbi:MAG: hypothetical protein AB2L11_11270 [Syntrophobacteraceae bacterium]